MSRTLATPSPSAKIASLSIGISTRLTMKPGASLAWTTVLPSDCANASTAATVASEVARPRISSIGFITGTGLKKWTPMKRAGSGVACASRVIGIDEVLVARIASSRSTLPTSAKICTLDRLALGRRLDDQIGRGERLVIALRLDPRERSIGIGCADLLLLDRAREPLGDARLALLRLREPDIRDEHAIARDRSHLNDARAHLARADHADDIHACLAPKPLIQRRGPCLLRMAKRGNA
jgi:hypothetical protein